MASNSKLCLTPPPGVLGLKVSTGRWLPGAQPLQDPQGGTVSFGASAVQQPHPPQPPHAGGSAACSTADADQEEPESRGIFKKIKLCETPVPARGRELQMTSNHQIMAYLELCLVRKATRKPETCLTLVHTLCVRHTQLQRVCGRFHYCHLLVFKLSSDILMLSVEGTALRGSSFDSQHRRAAQTVCSSCSRPPRAPHVSDADMGTQNTHTHKKSKLKKCNKIYSKRYRENTQWGVVWPGSYMTPLRLRPSKPFMAGLGDKPGSCPSIS